jgi:hypothetical protein
VHLRRAGDCRFEKGWEDYLFLGEEPDRSTAILAEPLHTRQMFCSGDRQFLSNGSIGI